MIVDTTTTIASGYIAPPTVHVYIIVIIDKQQPSSQATSEECRVNFIAGPFTSQFLTIFFFILFIIIVLFDFQNER